MAIVLPEHLTKGKSGAFVRKWLLGISAKIKAIFFFPEETFTPFGAMVKTCLLVLQKRGTGVEDSAEESTFV